jgi:hypothetical protein
LKKEDPVMQTQIIDGIYLIFNQNELDTAEVIKKATSGALILIQESWGLHPPSDCRIYVMTSWVEFIFQSAPWPWKPLLTTSFPFWAFRARRTWPYAGAWTQRYGKRVVIGVKPPRLLETSDKSFGLQMYVPQTDVEIKIQHFTCHELTHACAAHLKLPAWLNEGIAMLTVDRYMGKPTIRQDTLQTLSRVASQERPPGYAKLSRMKADVIIYYTLLGYWLVRYLEEMHPGFLKGLFSSPLTSSALESRLAEVIGLGQLEFWSKIPALLMVHFESGNG